MHTPALCRRAGAVALWFNVPAPRVLPKTHNQLQWQFCINTSTTSNATQPAKLDPVLLSSNTKSKPKRQLNGSIFLRKAEMLWQILQHRNTRTLNTARIPLRWTMPTTLHLLFQIHHGSQRRCLPNQTILWPCDSVIYIKARCLLKDSHLNPHPKYFRLSSLLGWTAFCKCVLLSCDYSQCLNKLLTQLNAWELNALSFMWIDDFHPQTMATLQSDIKIISYRQTNGFCQYHFS